MASSASASGYDPRRTTVQEATLADFLRNPITGDLIQIPGIGPANKAILIGVGINNTHQLIGKYLTLKNGTVVEHQDAMWTWLQDIGVNSHRHNIVLALAEKCDTMIPGLYDASLYPRD